MVNCTFSVVFLIACVYLLNYTGPRNPVLTEFYVTRLVPPYGGIMTTSDKMRVFQCYISHSTLEEGYIVSRLNALEKTIFHFAMFASISSRLGVFSQCRTGWYCTTTFIILRLTSRFTPRSACRRPFCYIAGTHPNKTSAMKGACIGGIATTSSNDYCETGYEGPCESMSHKN